tara:strand:+ start:116 stop:394 length:279 start_codon:yes stop_codon:yes gene_type:complete
MTNESIQHFFSFYENYSNREDMNRDIALGNLEEDHPYFKDLEEFESLKQFLENVFEVAFGDNAINKNYSYEEVLERLREFSDNAFKWEEAND